MTYRRRNSRRAQAALIGLGAVSALGASGAIGFALQTATAASSPDDAGSGQAPGVRWSQSRGDDANAQRRLPAQNRPQVRQLHLPRHSGTHAATTGS